MISGHTVPFLARDRNLSWRRNVASDGLRRSMVYHTFWVQNPERAPVPSEGAQLLLQSKSNKFLPSRIHFTVGLRREGLIILVKYMPNTTQWGGPSCLRFQDAHLTYFEMAPASLEELPSTSRIPKRS